MLVASSIYAGMPEVGDVCPGIHFNFSAFDSR